MDIKLNHSKRRTILIVDDDSSCRDLLARILRDAGFECLEARDVASVLLALEDQLPDAVMLENALPGTSGLEYLAILKEGRRTRDIPIILMSASATAEDRVAGLDLGADDFIVKPFAQLECIARLRAVLRRCDRQERWQNDADSDPIEYAGVHLDPLTHRVSVGGRYIRLGPSEFRLLRFFLRHPGRVHSRTALLAELHGPNPTILGRTIDVYVRRVRQALKRHGCDVLLQTVHGSGYQLSGSIEGSSSSRFRT